MPIPFELAPDEAVIRRFFTEVIDDDIHVAAIKPDGTNIGAYFGSDVEAAVDRAVKYNVSGRNIYWTANRCDEEVGSKPSKEEILSARFSQVDIDPPKNGSPFDKAGAISTLETCSLPPSVIVDSGNGIQALWRFAEDSSDFERVEGINRALIERFAGDSGFNIDKLMRVPGTVNYPNAAKLKRGCVPVMSRLVSYHPERLHTLNELEICFPIAAVSEAKVRAAVVVPDDVELLTSGDLSQGDTAKLRKMLDTPEDYFRNSDRSAWAFGIACQMVDDGYFDDEVLGILLNPANAGCAHVGDQADAMRAAVRTLTHAKERYLLPPGQSIFGDEAPSPSNRPTIRIVPGELADTIDLAEQALLVADLGYFQSGGRIVRVGVIPGAKLQGGAGRTRLIEVGQAEIGEAFTTAAVWLRTGPKGNIRADCPSVIAETYLARVGKWRLPPLAGVIDVPTLRPDGSLLSVAGYDGATGLLLVPSMQAFPTILDL